MCTDTVHVIRQGAAAPIDSDPIDGAGRQADSRPLLQDGLQGLGHDNGDVSHVTGAMSVT